MKHFSSALLGCIIASTAAAQSPPINPPSHDQQAPQVDGKDASKGQDVSGNPQPTTRQTTQTPTTQGQSTTTGNNLVGQNSGQMQNSQSARPEFKTIDINKRGYVMIGDVDDGSWLKSRFAQCDSNGDGRVTQQEYGACEK